MKGISRLEVLAVLIIFSLLCGVVAWFVLPRINSDISTQVNNDFDRIAAALERYKYDNKRYPTQEQGLSALLVSPVTPPQPRNWRGPYLGRRLLTIDPWNVEYRYLSSEAPPSFSLFTLGADSEESGSGTHRDIYYSAHERD